ncbi:MAG: hypothetical protein ACI4TF_17005 [Oliverpabstia sp.]
MHRESGKIVIKGNEFYEIDLECEKRKQEGKVCDETSKRKKEIKETEKK